MATQLPDGFAALANDPAAVAALPVERQYELAQLLDEVEVADARERLIPYVMRTTPDYRAAAVHHEMADALEAVERGEITRLLLTVPVRHGKTLLVSKRFVLWYMARNPGRHVMHCSYGADLATDAGRALRNLARDHRHLEIFPEAKMAEDSGRVDHWQLATGGEYVCAGVDGPIAGRGFNLGICDDLLKGSEAARSELQRDNVWRWYLDDFLSRRQHPNAIIFVTARWHEADPAGRIIERMEEGGEKWHVVNYPSLDEDDAALAPELIPREQLIETRAQVSPATWSALYQGNPTPDSGVLFNADAVHYYDDAPRWDDATRQWYVGDRPLRVYAASDWALSPHARADWSVHLIVGMDDKGTLWALDLWRKQASPEVTAAALLDLAARWKPVAWAEENSVVEKGVGPLVDRMARERGVYHNRLPYSSATDKVTKAQSIIGMWNAGRVRLPKAAPWTGDMVKEMLRFDRGRWDDQVDCWALAGRMISGMVGGRHPKAAGPGKGVVVMFPGNKALPEGMRAATWDDLHKINEREDRDRPGGSCR